MQLIAVVERERTPLITPRSGPWRVLEVLRARPKKQKGKTRPKGKLTYVVLTRVAWEWEGASVFVLCPRIKTLPWNEAVLLLEKDSFWERKPRYRINAHLREQRRRLRDGLARIQLRRRWNEQERKKNEGIQKTNERVCSHT